MNEHDTVTLDGSASSDPDGDAITYSWTQPQGQTGITLSSTTAQKPTFSAPEVTTATTYTFILTVSDGLATSTPSTVTVTVNNVNHPPVANAGPDQTVRSRQLVHLSGSGTDPDGDAIVAFAWTAPAGITLDDPSSATPWFVAPSVPRDTTYTLSLVVTDALGAASAPDTVTITVRRKNLNGH